MLGRRKDPDLERLDVDLMRGLLLSGYSVAVSIVLWASFVGHPRHFPAAVCLALPIVPFRSSNQREKIQ